MKDFEARSPLEQWLLRWCQGSDAYAEGEILVEPELHHWKCVYRSAFTGRQTIERVPRKGTPPPPGFD